MEKELSSIVTSIRNREGDLTKRVSTNETLELESLGNGINTFIESLQHIFSVLKEDVTAITHIVEEVSTNVHDSNIQVSDLSAFTEEISAIMTDLSIRSDALFTSSQKIGEDISTIATESTNITSYSGVMKNNAINIKASATESIKSIEDKTNKILHLLKESIKESERVKQVDVLTTEILSISEQTNLLALNASIEAARAGDAGKGFAVVAKEISSLAASSRNTSNKIKDINTGVISAVGDLANNATELVEYLTHTVLPEFETFIQVGNQYKTDAEYIELSMQGFKDRTEALNRVIEGNIDSINTITKSIQESTSGISDISDNAQALVHNMDKITEQMKINKNIADELQQESNVFKNF